MFLRGWVLISAYFSLLGWILALSGHFNATGYLIGVVLGVVLFAAWWQKKGASFRWKPLARRWRRPLPLTFALLFALIVAGAALHHPNNYDALTYRVSQMLHWLDAGRWQWIGTSDGVMNITAPGYGWFMAPAIALLHTDRLFALPNVIAFAFLPGLYFSLLRGCGVRGRVAWHWMWLIPATAGLVMQAGGIGNDLLPGTYALASVAFGLRAARQHSLEDFWYSALAVALVTGIKVTAAPLALVWVVATLPCWQLLRHRIVTSGIVAVVAMAISFIPTAVINTSKTGSWAGDPTNALKLRLDSPVQGVVGNSLMILAGALEPPVFPMANAAKEKFRHIDDTSFGKWIHQGFPRFSISSGELASEEGSGIGLSIFTLAVLSALAGWSHRKPNPARAADWGCWIGLASYAAFAVYLAKMGSEGAPRLAVPYYPFLLIPVLRGRGQEWLTRQRWWRVIAMLATLSLVAPVILTPARPLWPAQSTLAHLAARSPRSALLQRACDVYAVYAQRYDYLAPIKALLPPTAHTVGFIPTPNDIEATLWQPYGIRRYLEILTPSPTDPALFQLRGSAIIASQRGLAERFGLSPQAYTARIGGRILGEATLTQKVSQGPEKWFLITLHSE